MKHLLLLAIAVLLCGAVSAHAAITFTWDYADTEHDGFVMQRKAVGGEYADLGEVAPDKRLFVDQSPPPTKQTQYCYVLYAFNSEGRSEPSNEVCVTRRPFPKRPEQVRLCPAGRC